MVSRSATASAFLVVALAIGSPTAGWQGKKFEDWTVQDAQSVMTDSPWSKKIPMPAGGRPAMTVIEPGNNGAPPTASLGNPATATTGLNTTSAANAGRRLVLEMALRGIFQPPPVNREWPRRPGLPNRLLRSLSFGPVPFQSGWRSSSSAPERIRRQRRKSRMPARQTNTM